MGQFDDIVGIKKEKKKKSGPKCKKCGSTNIETSHKMYTGVVFNYNKKVYRRYRQFVRCYDCGKTEVIVDSDIIIGEPPEDVINIMPKISLPILRNISPISIWDEMLTLDEMIEDF